MTIACCICGRIRIGEHWVSDLDALHGRVSHTYCPVCLAKAREAMTGVHAVVGAG